MPTVPPATLPFRERLIGSPVGQAVIELFEQSGGQDYIDYTSATTLYDTALNTDEPALAVPLVAALKFVAAFPNTNTYLHPSEQQGINAAFVLIEAAEFDWRTDDAETADLRKNRRIIGTLSAFSRSLSSLLNTIGR